MNASWVANLIRRTLLNMESDPELDQIILEHIRHAQIQLEAPPEYPEMLLNTHNPWQIPVDGTSFFEEFPDDFLTLAPSMPVTWTAADGRLFTRMRHVGLVLLNVGAEPCFHIAGGRIHWSRQVNSGTLTVRYYARAPELEDLTSASSNVWTRTYPHLLAHTAGIGVASTLGNDRALQIFTSGAAAEYNKMIAREVSLEMAGREI